MKKASDFERFAGSEISFKLRLPLRVRVGVVDGSLGSSALHAYAVPLLGLFVGALGGSAVAGEIGAIGGSLGGLLAGWWGLRRAHLRSRDDPRFRPSIRS